MCQQLMHRGWQSARRNVWEHLRRRSEHEQLLCRRVRVDADDRGLRVERGETSRVGRESGQHRVGVRVHFAADQDLVWDHCVEIITEQETGKVNFFHVCF